MRRLIVALSFLTRLPMPRVTADGQDFAAAIRCYPLVGLVVGIAVAAACLAGAQVDPWLGALAGLTIWTAITGALHLDGLADVADGLGAAHGDQRRLLAVMSDPHIGSFGVVTLVIQLAAKLVLLHLLVAQPVAIALTPLAARIGPLLWARMLPPLKPTGLGAAVAGAVRARDWIGWLAVLAAAAVASPAALMAVPLMLIFGGWASAQIGGVTGDVHGAGIELVETGVLIAILCVGRL